MKNLLSLLAGISHWKGDVDFMFSGFYSSMSAKKINDWSRLIEIFFERIGYQYGEDFDAYMSNDGGYYVLKNPFGDGYVKSAMIRARNGNMRIYNSSLPTVYRNGVETKDVSITIIEYFRHFNLLNEYIDFILYKSGIKSSVYNEYRRILPFFIMNKDFNLPYREKVGFLRIRRFLFEFYINDTDVINTDKKLPIPIISKKFKSILKKEPKEKPQIVEANTLHKIKGKRYIEKRKIKHEKIKPCTVIWSGGKNSSCGVQLVYPDKNFVKIRLIESRKIRYIALGEYDCLFEARIKEGNKECFVFEGEFEALTCDQYLPETYDILALHNVNSLPSKNLTQLEKYDIINIRIDYDENFEKCKKSLEDKLHMTFPMKKCVVLPKFINSNKKIDYNEIHCNQNIELKSEWILNPEKEKESYNKAFKKHYL